MTIQLNGFSQGGISGVKFGSAFTPAAPGDVIFTSVGLQTWIAPAGVTSISVVAVGASGPSISNGSGHGAGLGWKNNIIVVPGQSYQVQVGAPTSYLNGVSFFISSATVSGGSGYQGRGAFTGDGGGYGGQGGYNIFGGGGSGGYTGAGVSGGRGGQYSASIAGQGGGGSGGGGASFTNGGGGGGVGLYGQGTSGAAVPYSGTNDATGGQAGSGGSNGAAGSGSTGRGGMGGLYGGGGGYGMSFIRAGLSGAVRIMWGTGRSFPSNAA
jgi:hypothetical protein